MLSRLSPARRRACVAAQDSFDLADQFDFDTEIEALALMFAMTLLVFVGLSVVNRVSILFLAAVLISVFSAVLGMIVFGAGGSFGDSDRL